MTLFDWSITVITMVLVIFLVQYTKRYVRTVSSFLVGGRVAGRYLLTVAGEMGAVGAISLIALWESQYFSGWGATWWGVLQQPFVLILVLSGWVIYRYRQTRSLTLAQFFEKRYSRNFRVFTGLTGFVAGAINYAIFPSVTSRFIIYVCGIPEYNVMFGGLTVSLSYALIMLIMVGFALWITLRSGQVGIMITDGIQGLIVVTLLLVLSVYLVQLCGWDRIGEALTNTPDPETRSMINPFKTSQVRDFNIWFYAIAIFGAFYSRMAWQGNSGYNAAAKSPHEARMAGILQMFRTTTYALIVGSMAMVAYTVMHHTDFADIAAVAQERITAILNPTVQKQMTVPLAISSALPVGLLGCLVVVVISMAVTTDDTYLLSWGSIFIQDVILPFRKTPLSPGAHLRLLRWSITGVAIFAYLFSLLFRQTQYIFMFFAITGALFTAGAGSAIIGGLYWKQGTTAGAWAAMLTGAVLSVSSIIIQQQPFHRLPVHIDAPTAASVMINHVPAVRTADGWKGTVAFWRNDEWQNVHIGITGKDDRTAESVVSYAYGTEYPHIPLPENIWPEEFSEVKISPATGSFILTGDSAKQQIYYYIRGINGQWMWFFSILIAIMIYIIVSLIRPQIFNMDKLLHRGQYATADVPDVAPVRGWRAIFRITDEFSLGDRIIYFSAMSWSLGWMTIYIVLIILNAISVRSDWFWVIFFKSQFYAIVVISAITIVWFGIGAVRDMREFCRTLAELEPDAADDGRVEK